jgi:lipoyl-dependent peroxiredoxin
MAAAESTAQATWEGDLAHGGGRVSPGSGAFGEQEVTWASRTRRSAGKTSPEELIAAAHAACFAMALSNTLGTGGNAPEHLEVSAKATFDPDAGRITTMELDVLGRVPGMEESEFLQAVEQADEGCPVSGALRGNVDVRLSASLES